MSPNYTHLIVNHIPVFSIIFGFLILLLSLFTSKKNLALVGYGLLFLGGISSIPAYFSGEDAEHFVEELSKISFYHLEEHEELGETSYIFNIILGILGLIGFIINRLKPQLNNITKIITLVFAAISIYFTVRTAQEGGKIRRPELWNETVENHSSEEAVESQMEDD